MSQARLPMLPIEVIKAGDNDSESMWGQEWSMWPWKGDIAFGYTRRRNKFFTEDVNASDVLDLLLAIASPDDALRFHQRVGMLVSGGVQMLRGERSAGATHTIITYSSILFWQKVVKDLTVKPIGEWREYAESLDVRPWDRAMITAAPVAHLVLWDGATAAVIREGTGLSAILSLLKVEKMCGAEYRHCARHDCASGVFRVESKHPRIYCSPECAHLVAVRNSRDPQRKRKARQR